MKRLLSLISALSLTSVASTTLIACSSDRIENPVLNRDLAMQIIAQLSGQNIANIDFGNIFSDADITRIVVAMINDLVARQYGYEARNTMLNSLGMQEFDEIDENGRLPEEFLLTFENSAATVAEDRLFTEYTRSIASGTRMDLSQLVSLYSLNPIRNITVLDINGQEVQVATGDQILVDGLVWGLFTEGPTTTLPTIAQLTNRDSMFTINGARISPTTALRLRFQDYFENNLMRNIAENLLTMTFLDSNSFLISETGDANFAPFINASSELFSRAQTWHTSNTTATGREWRTNVRMVWSLKFTNENGSNTSAAINLIRNLNQINTATGELNTGEYLMDLINYVASGISNNLGGIYNGDDSNAYDSFFYQQGFRGLTIYESGTAIGTSPIAGTNYENAVMKSARSGILMNGALPFFTDTDNGNISEFVFVLPVYMIELLGGSNGSNGNHNLTINDAGGDEMEINLGPSAVNPERFAEVWNQTNNRDFHSLDIQDLITNDANRRSLINQIQYVISYDNTVSTLARTIVYSRFLDADAIFYAGLWNQIGIYIRNEVDEDD